MKQIIARYGEMSLKGKNRGSFERVLEKNMRAVLAPWPDAKVSRINGRLLVTVESSPVEPVMAQLQRVFGIISLSQVDVSPLDLDDILECASRVLEGATTPSRTFKVEVRRSNKQFPMTSPEAAAWLGGALLERFQDWTVDVHSPTVTIYVDIRQHDAHIYGQKVRGAGGMPVGTAGRVGLLLSGGIDSPVAGWLCLKRGVTLEAIHFHSFPFTSERALHKVESLARTLAAWGGQVRLHTVHFTEVQTEIRKHCPPPLYITVMRRMMMRIATEIANRDGILALATGESLGQVASQTLESMWVINQVTNIPVLRPVVGWDKLEIIDLAKQIGTFETSILPYEDCCTVFVPPNPRIRPRQDEVESAERSLQVDRLVQQAVAQTTVQIMRTDERVE